MGLDYAREQMSRLVRTLAVDGNPLPQRMQLVFGYFADVIDDAEHNPYLPADLLARMKDVRRQQTFAEAHGNEGRLAASLREMTPEHAHVIVLELLDLASQILALKEGSPAD
jgi:hypothetical protein